MSTKQDKKVNPEDSLTSEEGWINVEEGRHDNLRYHKEPDRYFMLSVQSAAAPIELLALLGTIRKGKDWELLGFNPYTWRTGPLYHWACSGQGYVDIDGNRFNFSAHFAGIDRKWHKAITSGKRFVEHAFEVYWLRKLGVEFDEMVNLSEHTKAYAEARLAFEREDFLAAIGLAKRASELHPKEFNYIALFYQARRAAGDLSVIDEEMHYYRHDMEGAM